MTQSEVAFLSKRHVLQIKASTSPYSSFRAVTRNTSSPLYHSVTLPLHVGQSRCASTCLVNHTRFLKRKVLSVNAPTGQTSITLPENSLSIAFSLYVDISAASPRPNMPCTRLGVN